jgi:hypothetical protein
MGRKAEAPERDIPPLLQYTRGGGQKAIFSLPGQDSFGGKAVSMLLRLLISKAEELIDEFRRYYRFY